MKSYDCLVLYNAANISEREGCEEKLYPANIVREEVGAIEESLRSARLPPVRFRHRKFFERPDPDAHGDFSAVRVQPV